MRSHNAAYASPPAAPVQPARSAVPRAIPVVPSAHFVGRTAELEALIRVARRPGSVGVAVIGAPGVGKTTLLNEAHRVLAHAYIIRIRGRRAFASVPYHALDLLLPGLSERVMHPALAFSAISDRVRANAAGRRVVFSIDDAEHLDAASSTLIGQFVSGNSASVILTASDFARVDPVFMGLWRASSLGRLDLAPLTFREAGSFVRAELGAPVSREAVQALWSAGGGNPQAIRAALTTFVQGGVLARRGSSWVLLPGRRVIGREAVEASPLLECLTRAQRRVVDLVALAGSLRWRDLAQLVDTRDLDALQDAGVIVIEAGVEPRVSLAAAHLAEALADTLAVDEARELHRLLLTRPAAAADVAARPAHHVRWLVRAGLPVSEASGVAAAAALNDKGRHADADALIASLPELVYSYPMVLQSMVASLGQGHLRGATASSARLLQATGLLTIECSTAHLLEEARLRRLQFLDRPSEPLDRALAQLALCRERAENSGDAARLPALLRLQRRVEIGQADLASFEGRYGSVLTILEGMSKGSDPRASGREEHEARISTQALLVEALALQDQQDAALEQALVLARELSHADVSRRVVDEALTRVEAAFLVVGRWEDAVRILEGLGDSPDTSSPRRGPLAEVADALALIAQDRAREAVDLLDPVVEQLRIADAQGLLPLAAAVRSYGQAFTRPRDSGAGQVLEPESGQGSAWIIRRAARHYRLLASSLTNPEETAMELQERAAMDLGRGVKVLALTTLTSCVRLGHLEAVEQLAAVAGILEGPLARTGQLLARALTVRDAHFFIAGMEAAAATQDYRLVLDFSRLGCEATSRRDDRAGLRAIQRRTREVLPVRLRGGDTVAGLELLTAREREIAELAAAGSSNRAIAERMFVSVRTVEGHLYQVYTKVKVRTRAELAEVLPPGGRP
ncbi:LuxR C-terminal-related transcriptional regulator [Arthrobacter agilis]|uniref:helix-turn-helix transcriptional regulator n=1 Tax=Arthrobacter agilis TaxID=37921 RepID=UPI00236640C0|nr:LuxR C-terminal-related transcriptional regulator [Arthrobacter agilis]WDF34258.1 LuxR C-terminal-related transcriptional regulator [Arthrobacter agilis]